MATRSSALKPCAKDIWFAEGCFDSHLISLVEIKNHLQKKEEDDEIDVLKVEVPGGRGWSGDEGVVLHATWLNEDKTSGKPVELRAALHLFEKEGMRTSKGSIPGFSNPLIKDMADSLGVDMEEEFGQVGGWRIIAEAPEGMAWDPAWLSPARTLFGHTPARWGDPGIGLYSLDHVNSLCDSTSGRFRKLFRTMSRTQGTNTVIFAIDTDTDDQELDETVDPALEFFHSLRGGLDDRRTLVMAIHEHALYEANRVLTQEYKTSLEPGGAIILPHTPHRSISRSRLQIARKDLTTAAVRRMLTDYTKTPQNMDPVTFAMLRDLQMGGVLRDPHPAKAIAPQRSSEEPVVPASTSRREEALQELVDDLRGKVKDLQGEVSARVAPSVVEDLRKELEAERMKTDSDLMRRAAAAAALQVKVLEQIDEERVRELDGMAARLAYLTSELGKAGRGDVIEGPVPQETFSSWEELFEEAEKQFPLVVIGPVVVSHARKLASHPQSGAWMNKTWQALRTLSNYAEDREHSGEKDQIFNYVRRPDGRSLIAATLYRAGESNVTMKNGTWFNARVFEVPTTVSPDGRAFMGEHIVIGGGSHPAPRMHLLDATNTDGRVYVGYVGEHLPNTLS